MFGSSRNALSKEITYCHFWKLERQVEHEKSKQSYFGGGADQCNGHVSGPGRVVILAEGDRRGDVAASVGAACCGGCTACASAGCLSSRAGGGESSGGRPAIAGGGASSGGRPAVTGGGEASGGRPAIVAGGGVSGSV